MALLERRATRGVPTLPAYPRLPKPTVPTPSDVNRTRSVIRYAPAGSVVAAEGKILPVCYGRQALKPFLGAALYGTGDALMEYRPTLGTQWIICTGEITGVDQVFTSANENFPAWEGGSHGQQRGWQNNDKTYLVAEQFHGTKTQTASPFLQTLEPSYADTCVFTENALEIGQSYLVFLQNDTLDVELVVPTWVVVRGLACYDPRGTPTTAYTTNPALQLADFLSASYGANWTADWASVGDAADRCDEIPNAPTDNKKRYRGGFSVTDTAQIPALIERLRALCGIIVRREGNKFWFVINKAGASVFTFDSSKIIAGTERVSYVPTTEIPESVAVEWTKAYQEDAPLWPPWVTETVVYPGPGDPGYSNSVDERRTATVQFLDCQHKDMATRYARLVYLQAQASRWRMTFDSRDMAAALYHGEIVTVDHPQLPEAMEFRITQVRVVHGQLDTRWRVTLEEYNAGVYSDQGVTEPAPPAPPSEPERGETGSTIMSFTAGEFIDPTKTLLITRGGATAGEVMLATCVGVPIKQADGYVRAGDGGNAGDVITVYLSEGVADQLSGIAIDDYYLGENGEMVTRNNVPANALFHQRIGVAADNSNVIFHAWPPIFRSRDLLYRLTEYTPVIKLSEDALFQVAPEAMASMPCGWLEDGEVTRAGFGQINVAAGKCAVGSATKTGPATVEVWDELTFWNLPVAPPNGSVFVYYDSATAAIGAMDADLFGNSDIRSKAVLARIDLNDLGSIQDADSVKDYRYQADGVEYTFIDYLISSGQYEFAESGFMLSGNAGGLTLALSAGVIFRPGINLAADFNNPNRALFPEEPTVTFDTIIRDDSVVTQDGTAVNVTQWDNNGVLSSRQNNRFVMHVLFVRDNHFFLQLGQNQDARTIEEALANFGNLWRSFVVADGMQQPGVYVAGAVFVKTNASDFADLDETRVFDRTYFPSQQVGGGGGTAGYVLSVDGNYPDADGNVSFEKLGINLAGAAPTEALDIGGNGGNVVLHMHGSGANASNIITDQSPAVAGTPFSTWLARWDGTNVARLRFSTGDDTVNKDNADFRIGTAEGGGTIVDRVTVDWLGHVGIGTTAPSSLLHLQDDSANIEFKLEGIGAHASNIIVDQAPTINTAFSTYLARRGGTNVARIRFSAGAGTDDADFRVGTSSGGGNIQDRLIVDPSGRVGIGTTAPTSLVHVRDDSALIDLQLYGAGANASNISLEQGITTTYQPIGTIRWRVSGSNVAQVRGLTGSATDCGELRFRTSAGGAMVDHFVVTEDGNLGAGIMTPKSKLSVAGLVSNDEEYDNGNSGLNPTVDWLNGNQQKVILTANPTTFAFSAPAVAAKLTLRMIQDAGGNKAPILPASVKWAGGVAPTWSTVAGRVDVVRLDWNGTDYSADALIGVR